MSQTNTTLDTCRAELKSTFEGPASLVRTNDGIASTTKLTGSIYFTVSNAPVPILEEAPVVEVPVATPTPVAVGGSTPSSAPKEPSGVEEARLLKHFKSPSNTTTAVRKPSNTQLTQPLPKMQSSPQVLIKPAVEVSIPPVKFDSETPQISSVSAQVGTTTSTDSSKHDAEEARIMKHLFTKGSKPALRPGSGSPATPGTPTLPSKFGNAAGTPSTPGTASSDPATPPTLPPWKVKQMEREREDRERREQERKKINAMLEAQAVAAAAQAGQTSADGASSGTTNTAASTSTSTGNSISGSVSGNTSVDVKSSVFGTPTDAETEAKLKREEERLLKLMSGAGKAKMGGIKS